MYAFVPYKLFDQILEIFNSEFSYVKVWFTDQNCKSLFIENNINLTLVINWCVIYKMRYPIGSIGPKNWILVKSYGFLSFTKYMGKNIGKNIGKNLSDKYSLKLIDHAKQSATDVFKTVSEKAI